TARRRLPGRACAAPDGMIPGMLVPSTRRLVPGLLVSPVLELLPRVVHGFTTRDLGSARAPGEAPAGADALERALEEDVDSWHRRQAWQVHGATTWDVVASAHAPPGGADA